MYSYLGWPAQKERHPVTVGTGCSQCNSHSTRRHHLEESNRCFHSSILFAGTHHCGGPSTLQSILFFLYRHFDTFKNIILSCFYKLGKLDKRQEDTYCSERFTRFQSQYGLAKSISFRMASISVFVPRANASVLHAYALSLPSSTEQCCRLGASSPMLFRRPPLCDIWS